MDIDRAFEDIAAAMQRLEQGGDDSQARQAAKRHGLVEVPDALHS